MCLVSHHTDLHSSVLSLTLGFSIHDKQISGKLTTFFETVDPSVLDFSLSSHRHTYASLLFTSRFID
jgi:hypothetical protein